MFISRLQNSWVYYKYKHYDYSLRVSAQTGTLFFDIFACSNSLTMNYKPDPSTLGLIFDLDGTLADTMPLHFKAWQLTCREFGMEMTREFLKSHMGRPGWEISLDLIKEHGLSDKISGEEFKDAKIRVYKTLEHKVKPIAPVAEIVLKYYGKLPMSVGTGGFTEAAHKTLSKVNMSQYFDIVVTADDVKHHKPHPETFLKCAERMQLDPGLLRYLKMVTLVWKLHIGQG